MDLKAKEKKKNTAILGTMGGMVWEQFGAMYWRRSESAFLLQRSVLERPAFHSFISSWCSSVAVTCTECLIYLRVLLHILSWE